MAVERRDGEGQEKVPAVNSMEVAYLGDGCRLFSRLEPCGALWRLLSNG